MPNRGTIWNQKYLTPKPFHGIVLHAMFQTAWVKKAQYLSLNPYGSPFVMENVMVLAIKVLSYKGGGEIVTLGTQNQ